MSDVSPEHRERKSRYLDLLLEVNEQMNLTRIRDRAHAEMFHIGDAMALLPFLPTGECAIADIGSGGGVPGIPLAIVRPDAQVVLIESVKKKADFLRATKRSMELKNVQVYHGRVEAYPNRSGAFDVVVCRAVASLETLLGWAKPLLKKDGILLAMKGPKLEQELLEAAKVIEKHAVTITTHPYELGGQIGRVIAKVGWDSSHLRAKPVPEPDGGMNPTLR